MATDTLHIHKFKETVVPPTCTTNGYTLYTCECGYEHKANFQPVAAHNFQIAQSTPATCQAPGSVTAVCSVCGETTTRTLEPIGHTYGDWIVQTYPTCQTAGTRVRKCYHCEDTQTGVVNPLGHQCAPGTARQINATTSEYFCSSCGQNIRRTVENIRLAGGSAGCWPTRVILILSAVMSLMRLVVMQLSDISFITPWLGYSYLALMLVWPILFTVAAPKIKNSKTYTCWMGAAMLSIAVAKVLFMIFNVLWYQKLGVLDQMLIPIDIFSTCILPYLGPIAFFTILGVVLFIGNQKKTWVFVVALVYVGLNTLINVANVVLLGNVMSIYSLVSTVSYWLFLAGIIMLIAPNKKQWTQQLVETVI